MHSTVECFLVESKFSQFFYFQIHFDCHEQNLNMFSNYSKEGMVFSHLSLLEGTVKLGTNYN